MVTDECLGNEKDGLYIMSPNVQDGTKKNHKKYSQCCIDRMNKIILNRIEMKKDCFEKSVEASCGNMIVERDNGEECDCGYDYECGLDSRCCHPKTLYSGGLTGNSCKKKLGALCSLSEGVCCEVINCNFKPKVSLIGLLI